MRWAGSILHSVGKEGHSEEMTFHQKNGESWGGGGNLHTNFKKIVALRHLKLLKSSQPPMLLITY